jgi:peptide/nickel transport system substrate-binding protein
MSTDPIRVVDPAAITDAASTALSLGVFQRLMTARPGESVLKPDAARDCLFTARTVYTCTLNDESVFSNGHPLTSSDVKFSIARATRLAVPGSSAPLLDSLRRIDTPDPKTVQFVLSRVDTQFGWALASPAASIVDEEVYNADELSSREQPIVGSGPFQVAAITDTELRLAKFADYLGPSPARMPALTYRVVPDSAAIEDAMSRQEVDVVWRGLNAAAISRYGGQAEQSPEGETAEGYTVQALTGVRVRQLVWSPTAPGRRSADLRQAVAAALQGDRTLNSVVPGGIPGHIATFPLGGRASPKVTWKTRIQLTLAYDPTAPDSRDVANQIRTRLEDTGGLSVRLRPDDPGADLTLVDRKAWTATALAWMQPYLAAPLPSVAATVSTQVTQYRASTDDAGAPRLLAALQRQAALDLVVLPLTQGNEYLLARSGVDIDEFSFGPGWQLGLFGIRGG